MLSKLAKKLLGFRPKCVWVHAFSTISSVQFSSFSSVPTLCNPMVCSMPGFPAHDQVYPNSCPLSQWCYPTISSSVAPSPLALSLSQHQGLCQWIISSHQVVKYWSFSFNTSPSNEYSGLISFRIDRLDLIVVQGTLKSLLQHHNWKASIHWRSAYLWSNSYIHTWLRKKT